MIVLQRPDAHGFWHLPRYLMAFSQEQVDLITSMAKSYGVTRQIVFGSAQDSPDAARDIDLACDGVAGWKLYELAARLEEQINAPLDLVPLTPSNRFTQMIERRGRRLI
jgi:predicted nucleotidyltransferase